MKIYIITRFNIPIKFGPGGKKIKSISPNQDIGYLNERFELFEQYTFPSVMNQSCQEFEWIVMFYKKTPNYFENKINEYEKYKPFTKLYVDDGENWKNILRQYVNQTSQIYMTVRLDNDDGLHKNFIKCLRKQQFKGNTVITFPHGAQYSHKHHICVKYSYIENHFTALMTDCGNNILEYDHTKLPEYLEVTGIETQEPMWLEVLHETNYGNQLFARLRDVFVRRINIQACFPMKDYKKEQYILFFIINTCVFYMTRNVLRKLATIYHFVIRKGK